MVLPSWFLIGVVDINLWPWSNAVRYSRRAAAGGDFRLVTGCKLVVSYGRKRNHRKLAGRRINIIKENWKRRVGGKTNLCVADITYIVRSTVIDCVTRFT